MFMTGYGRDAVQPKLTDEALVDLAREYLTQCHESVKCITYQEGLVN